MKQLLAGLHVVAALALPMSAAAQSLPEGTIIAWRPPLDAIDFARKTVDLPKGWKACDFSGSPQSSLYLKGVKPEDYAKAADPADPALKRLYGGAPQHTHSARTERSQDIKNNLSEDNETHASDSLHTHPVVVDPAPNDPPFAAVIWLCAKGDQALAEFTSYGYGGNAISLARTGKSFGAPAPRSYAVCNTGAAAATVEFNPLPMRSGVPKTDSTIGKGECFGVDAPHFLRATSVTGKDVIDGQYYALRAGTFPKEGKKFKADDPALRRSIASGRVGAFDYDEMAPPCTELPKTSPLRKDFYSSCAIPLPQKGDYRICLPKGYLTGAPDNYAFGNIRMILDPRLIKTGFVGMPSDPSSAAPMGSCIDVWDTDAAIVLIWPAAPGQPPHDPTLISGIRATVRTLGAEAPRK